MADLTENLAALWSMGEGSAAWEATGTNETLNMGPVRPAVGPGKDGLPSTLFTSDNGQDYVYDHATSGMWTRLIGDSGQPFTIAFWAKRGPTNGASISPCGSTNQGGTTKNPLRFVWTTTSLIWDCFGSGNRTSLASDLTTQRAWHHYILTYSGGQRRVFIDGVAQIPETVTTDPVETLADYEVAIGAGFGSVNQLMDGEILGVHLYSEYLGDDSAATTEKRGELYNGGTAVLAAEPFQPAGTIDLLTLGAVTNVSSPETVQMRTSDREDGIASAQSPTDQVVHPVVVRGHDGTPVEDLFAEGLLSAFITPFPGKPGPADLPDTAQENPSVLAFDQFGGPFTAPGALENPVVTTPPTVDSKYHTDVHGVWDGEKLVMWWRRVSDDNLSVDVFVKTLAAANLQMPNGRDDWTAEEGPLHQWSAGTAGSDVTSPTATWEGGTTYRHYMTDDTPANDPSNLVYREQTGYNGQWGAPVACRLHGVQDSKSINHAQVVKAYGYYHIMVMVQTFSPVSLTDADIYYGTSQDGVNFYLAKSPQVVASGGIHGGIYKSDFLLRSGVMEVWYTAQDGNGRSFFSGSGSIPVNFEPPVEPVEPVERSTVTVVGPDIRRPTLGFKHDQRTAFLDAVKLAGDVVIFNGRQTNCILEPEETGHELGDGVAKGIKRGRFHYLKDETLGVPSLGSHIEVNGERCVVEVSRDYFDVGVTIDYLSAAK